MPKQRKSGNKSKTAEPESEIDFLEAADEQETGGNKWRAGDAVKAARFYLRALNIYDAGLQKFSNSFDLSYNKAHLLYELSQNPRISPHLGPRIEVLRKTLDAHRYALRLNEENSDILFNTAQVLTSIAEEQNPESNTQSASHDREDAISSLREALELFNSCLSRQEMELSEQQALSSETVDLQRDATRSEVDYSPIVVERTKGQEILEEQWANVEEPTTAVALVETALAALSCLGTLISFSVPAESRILASLTEIAYPLIQSKIPAYLAQISDTVVAAEEETPKLAVLSITSDSSATFEPSAASDTIQSPRESARQDCDLSIASFRASLADAEYRSNLSSVESYASRLREAYEPLVRPSSGVGSEQKTSASLHNASYNFNLASEYADALDDFAEIVAQAKADGALEAALAATELASTIIDANLSVNIINGSLSDNLTTMKSIPKGRIMNLRGDIALRKYTLEGQHALEGMSANDPARFYTAAAAYFRKASEKREVDSEGVALADLLLEASAKQLIAQSLTRSPPSLSVPKPDAISNSIPKVLEEMSQRGLLDPSFIKALLGS